ncbi:MAG: helix-turn-helix transcriptional regulator [Schleiferilactobacillus perolens]|jgi:Rgg/GadR/MutR family transcriptional activator|uniref:helix-turn-helix domain-containing protein n=1 Tax=Schleiferilactobacillus perolens TaxID=100468 RepID=UPI0039E930F9|nr:helix-turn-helix transcriptional regulator [Schleiferilactobacillus harbinensis]MCI1913686.1 helix-turn-helix transcriptional regulator [Schleiferilactobacillus harbinensis]
MMTYGETFRYFRKSKGLTLKQVADDMNSVSLIGQFETNHSRISVERFVHLLSQIAVSYDEFQVKRRGTTRTPVQQQIHDFQALMSIRKIIADDGQHISEEELRRHFQQLRKENEGHYNLQLAQYVDLVQYQWEHKPTDSVTESYPRQLQLYFAQVDEWGLYELMLLNQCFRIFPVAISWQLLQIVRKKVTLIAKLPGYNSEIANVYFSAITAFTARHDLAKAWQTWHLAEKFCRQQNAEGSAILLPAMAGWITLHEGHEERARALFDQTLEYYNMLSLTEMHDRWQQILEGQISAYHKKIPQYFVFVTPFE